MTEGMENSGRPADEMAELEQAEAERASGTIEYVSHEELARRIGA